MRRRGAGPARPGPCAGAGWRRRHRLYRWNRGGRRPRPALGLSPLAGHAAGPPEQSCFRRVCQARRPDEPGALRPAVRRDVPDRRARHRAAVAPGGKPRRQSGQTAGGFAANLRQHDAVERHLPRRSTLGGDPGLAQRLALLRQPAAARAQSRRDQPGSGLR